MSRNEIAESRLVTGATLQLVDYFLVLVLFELVNIDQLLIRVASYSHSKLAGSFPLLCNDVLDEHKHRRTEVFSFLQP